MRGARWIPLAAVLAALMGWGASAPADERATADERVGELFQASFEREAAGELSEALARTQAVLRQAPDDYVATLRAGWLHYRLGQYPEAVRLYERAGALAPAALEPRLGSLLPLMASSQWGRAEGIARELLRAAPRDYLAGSRLAWVLFNQGKLSEAEARYRAVLADYPSDTEMMAGLGWTCLKQGEREEARAQFRAVLRIHPRHPSALAGLRAP